MINHIFRVGAVGVGGGGGGRGFGFFGAGVDFTFGFELPPDMTFQPACKFFN